MNIETISEFNPVDGVREIKHLAVGVNTPFKFDEIIISPGCKSPVDQHAVVEIWQVLSGEGSLLYKDALTTIRAGDRVFYYPHETHQVENIGQTDLVVLSIYWNA